MGNIRIDALEIKEFRKFKNVRIGFEKPITLLVGQNGTAKSTLLGMLAQPFSFGNLNSVDDLDRSVYISNYNGMRLAGFKDIAGNIYTYPCDKIFRLSKEHDTPDKPYIYETKLSGIDFSVDSNSPLKTKKLLTVNQARGRKLRFVTGPGANESPSHNPGEGNFPHPVIYMSLGRLLPLAEVESCNISRVSGSLRAEEAEWYEKAYREIFSVIEDDTKSGIMETKEKKTSIVPIAADYDGESCSAGQDNIGRLLTAILSFRRLKGDLGEKYRGGLLLIDEIDATLHPASQIRLMRLLVRELANVSVQLVVTTHSLFLVKECSQSDLKESVGIVLLERFEKCIKAHSDVTFDDMEADLKNIAIPPPKRKRCAKVTVVLEDGVAATFLKFLVKKMEVLSSKVAVANLKGKGRKKKPAHLSGEYLKIMANNAATIPELQKVIFIPDGDMDWAKKSKNANVLVLPGTEPIEKQVYRMLASLPDEDAFWSRCDGTNYNKRVVIGNETEMDDSNIDEVKVWFAKQKDFWGRGLSIVFEEYYQLNKNACDRFLCGLKKLVNRNCT